jgi:hypothetical protein
VRSSTDAFERGVSEPFTVLGVEVPDFEACFAARSALRFCLARELMFEDLRWSLEESVKDRGSRKVVFLGC